MEYRFKYIWINFLLRRLFCLIFQPATHICFSLQTAKLMVDFTKSEKLNKKKLTIVSFSLESFMFLNLLLYGLDQIKIIVHGAPRRYWAFWSLAWHHYDNNCIPLFRSFQRQNHGRFVVCNGKLNRPPLSNLLHPSIFWLQFINQLDYHSHCAV